MERLRQEYVGDWYVLKGGLIPLLVSMMNERTEHLVLKTRMGIMVNTGTEATPTHHPGSNLLRKSKSNQTRRTNPTRGLWRLGRTEAIERTQWNEKS